MDKKVLESVVAFGGGMFIALLMKLAYRFIRTRYVRAGKCGHMTSVYPEKGEYVQRVVLRAYGEKQEIVIKGERPNYCRRCLNEMTVRCFACRKPIFYDDTYTLMRLAPDDWCREEYGLVEIEGVKYGACCIRMETGCQVTPDKGAHSAAGRWKSVSFQ